MSKLKWTGGQDAVQDVSGEYNAVDGFTYQATLLESVRGTGRKFYLDQRPLLRVHAELSIDAMHHGERRWSLSVRIYPVHIIVARGTCGRTDGAKRDAQAELEKRDFVREALVQFYALRFPVSTLAGEPVMTLLGWEDGYLLPYGQFVVERAGGRKAYVSRFGSGYSSSSNPRLGYSAL